MSDLKLFMIIIGCKPKGRFTEQHDVFFGISETMRELIPQMNDFWKEAKGAIHIDAWRQVSVVNGYKLVIKEKNDEASTSSNKQLFFINLGGYKENEFEEYHYKIITAATNKGEAIKLSKQTAFYKHVGFKGAESHIDDKYGIDVDDLYEIKDILPEEIKTKYVIELIEAKDTEPDKLHIGYLMMSKLERSNL